MPVVAVGALGIVMAALLAAALMWGMTLLAKAAGNLVPNWHIPGLGNLRSAVINGSNAAFQAVVGWLDQAIGPVGNFFLAPFHIVKYLLEIATSLGQSIYNALNRLGVFVVQAYRAAVKYAAETATGVAHMAISLYYKAVKIAAEYATTAARLAITLYGRALQYAAEVATGVARMAITLYNRAITYAAQVATTAARLAITLWERAEADLTTAERALSNYARGLFVKAEADAAAAAARAEAVAKAFASTAVADASKVIATDIVTPIEQAWVDVRDEVAAIEQILATDLPDVRALLGKLAIPRVADITAATGALAAVDVLVLRYLRDCGIPSCKSLHDLVHDLPNLFALTEGAGMLALLAGMVHDPAGTANELDSIVRPIVTDTTDVFASVVGL